MTINNKFQVMLRCYFFFVFGEVDWNTLDADIKFSIYWPRTWFSDLNFRFSSLTLSTLCDKSATEKVQYGNGNCIIYTPSKVFCNSKTCDISLAFSSCSSRFGSGSKLVGSKAKCCGLELPFVNVDWIESMLRPWIILEAFPSDNEGNSLSSLMITKK